ncbi:MAG: hypothetical protein ACI4RA_07700, partial [Kiritimatiellia bacterium]
IVPSEEEFFKASGSTYTLKQNGETGVWECRFNESAYLAQVLAADGTTVLKRCLSLTDAIKAAQTLGEGATVQMLADFSGSYSSSANTGYTFAGTDVAIDMNGHNIEVAGTRGTLGVPAGQTLTLMNSQAGTTESGIICKSTKNDAKFDI